ncbi:MAG: PSD1 and planctomycete cytochrome C domain-containing protein [Fuerstiella sp.]|nr:PSD1 and planctomycete cytochrome C domain-containing protein [Fuerstiella sp.]
MFLALREQAVFLLYRQAFLGTIHAMKKVRPPILVTWLICLLTAVFTMDSARSATADGVEYFEKHIRPLLAKHCYSCHSSRTGKREGGLVLDTRAGWTVGGDSGPAIMPENVDASLLIQAVRYKDPARQMPPDRALPQKAIALLEHWVQMGAPDPRDKPMEDITPNTDPSDPIAGREHWAFQLLSQETLPAVKTIDSPKSAIDTFILLQLEKANLQPAADADRRTLVRRAYLQLTGLPPTPQQLTAFLEDDGPDAFEKLVDQLLDSPRFGERWGRHWLDLARYADSNGLDENFLFREAWRYRNWVIDAVNADVPFDRFLLEQIAGDLLPHDSIEQRDRQRIAAGFLVMGPKVLLGNDPKERRMDVADEQLDTIGRAVLGQTLGCARCHNHKFDPVPTADYYALAGIFTSTQVMQRRYMLGQQRGMERLVGLGADGDKSNDAYEKYWRERPKLTEKQKHAKSALELLEKGDTAAFDEFVAKHKDAVAEAAADTKQPTEQRVAAQKTLVAELDAAVAKPPAIPPRAMIPSDEDKPADESIRLAGQFNRLGKQVPRGFLSVVSDAAVEIPEGQSGRLELARWLTDLDTGAGRLTARVLANRVWHHLIGRGIVRTVDNFGRTGEAPSHPELLDHLAAAVIDSGWSMKSLVRKIVLTRTFAMSSLHDEASHAVDPENRLLWRAHRRRLTPEALRDSMLLAAGTLDVTPLDSTVSYLGDQATAVGENKNRRRTDFPCRSVYLPVIRNDLPELFDVFDFADPHAATGMRPQTMVATQGLFMLNDAQVMNAAQATARRVLDNESGVAPTAKIDRLFELVLNEIPTTEERDELLRFISETRKSLNDDDNADADTQVWSMVCHALFASSRFQIVE